MISVKRMPLITCLAIILLNGCDGERNRETHDYKQVISSNYTTKADAIAIAKKETEKRHWPGVKVSSVRFEGSNWVVELERIPQSYGGQATVHIGTNGQVFNYTPSL